jgi:preprotein translocase subunit SecE
MATMTAERTDNFGDKVKSWPQRVKSFYTDVRMEMKKVTTPTRKEVQATTAVVIITVFLFGAYFWVIDNTIAGIIDRILRQFTHR